MKKIFASMAPIAVITVLIVLISACNGGGGSESGGSGTSVGAQPAANTPDPQKTCVVSSSDFDNWFGGKDNVKKDAWVNPANSLAPLNNNCDFYAWSWQMFLWNMSPKDGAPAFDQPPFFDLEGSKLVQNGTGTQVRGGKVEAVGQAGVINGVLKSQDFGVAADGSLVYYAIHVNDVYAYFASGKSSNAPSLKGIDQFPTTQAEIDKIKAFAETNYNAPLPDADALAMELKSSWVKVKEGVSADDYITIDAEVPSYVKESDQKWTWDGKTTEKATLAMVGYHLVGSVNGHPEMVWATFEHKDNVADATYYYTNTNKDTVQHRSFDQSTDLAKREYLFTSKSVKYNASNQMHMETGYNNPNNIVAVSGNTISASSTARTHPWGNKPDKSSIGNNTMIMSINQNVQGQLISGDVRANYILVGATLTQNGVPGVGNQRPEVAGSMVLANSTMETYFQYKNCFDCHQGGSLGGLSHIFDSITPLPKPSNN